jgi:hypothetical protein
MYYIHMIDKKYDLTVLYRIPVLYNFFLELVTYVRFRLDRLSSSGHSEPGSRRKRVVDRSDLSVDHNHRGRCSRSTARC